MDWHPKWHLYHKNKLTIGSLYTINNQNFNNEKVCIYINSIGYNRLNFMF